MYAEKHTRGAAKSSLPLLYFVVIALVGLAVYLNSFDNGFVWDDHHLIVNNSFINEPHVLKLFTEDLDKTSFSKTLFYRPLQNISYLLDRILWRNSVFGYHVTNALLHLINAMIVFILVGWISRNRTAAFLTALLFVAHPMHYGVVTYLSGRADSLGLLFFLLSFLAFIRYRDTSEMRMMRFMALGFTLSILSKEMALIGIVVFMLYDFIFRMQSRSRKDLFGPYAVLFAILIAYTILRKPHFVASFSHELNNESIFTYILTFPKIIVMYITSLMLPVDLGMRRLVDLEPDLLSMSVTLPSLFIAFLILFSLKVRKRNKAVSFFILYFLITLLPVSNIFVKVNALMADHWVYIPSIGYFFILSLCLTSISGYLFRKNRLVLGLLLVGIYGSLTIQQNRHWADDVTLFTHTLSAKPDDALVRGNLGLSYLERGDFNKAIVEEAILIKDHPGYAHGYCNMGSIYFRMKKFDKALEYFKKSIEIDPELDKAYLFTGLIYEERGNYKDAESAFRRFIELSPHSGLGYVNMGVLEFSRGTKDKSLGLFETAIRKDPGSATAYIYLSSIYRERKRYEESLALLERAVEIEPYNIGILMDLGNTYNSFGIYEKAVSCFRRGLYVAPRNSALWYNLGTSYLLQNDKDRARRYWMHALELRPSFKEAIESLEALNVPIRYNGK
ncbi:MAG: tetratricopeptide repeat protein [Candidatus Omnitrophota bacterium]